MSGCKNLIHIISSNRWRGVERYALDICCHFRDRGWNVAAITRDAKAVDSLFEKAGVPLVHAPLWGMFDISSIRILSKLMKQADPEGMLVHVHGFRQAFSALLSRKLSRRKDIRIIMTRHKVKAGRESILLKRIYRNIDDIIFVSRLSRDIFLSTWQNRKSPFREGQLHVIQNSINLPVDKYQEKEAKGPVIAMFHGPLVPGKGLETLISALPRTKGVKFRLRIIGSGKPDYVDRLRRMAQSLGVMEMIDWHKHVDDPMSLIAEADFGVLPSDASEAFGLANIEYMACGRPQITTSNGAQPEYLRDGSDAFFVEPGNVESLAEAIKKLASDRSLCVAMGRNAHDSFTRQLAWNDFAEKITRIYNP